MAKKLIDYEYTPTLFRTNNRWHHFIGKTYTTKRFLKEAAAVGISRRVPATMAAAMEFGDRVVLFRWNGADEPPVAIGEMVITRIQIIGELAEMVGAQLVADGHATKVDAAPVMVQRECGSYTLGGGWKTDASVSDIMAIANQLAGGEKVEVLIGGKLIETYDPPYTPEFAPRKFHRGFGKLIDDQTFSAVRDAVNDLIFLDDYQKR